MGTNGTILLVGTLRRLLPSFGDKGKGYGAPDGIPLNPADQGEQFTISGNAAQYVSVWSVSSEGFWHL